MTDVVLRDGSQALRTIAEQVERWHTSDSSKLHNHLLVNPRAFGLIIISLGTMATGKFVKFLATISWILAVK